jgi:hypothetical protein
MHHRSRRVRPWPAGTVLRGPVPLSRQATPGRARACGIARSYDAGKGRHGWLGRVGRLVPNNDQARKVAGFAHPQPRELAALGDLPFVASLAFPFSFLPTRTNACSPPHP